LLPPLHCEAYPFFLSLVKQPEVTEEVAVVEEKADEAVCYLRGVHMSPYKVTIWAHIRTYRA